MIVYLHGFNSSAQSHKAQVLARYLEERGLGAQYACPGLPPHPAEAIRAIEAFSGACFVGSSLGGFYATYMAEKHGARAVLINPAIDPHVGLRAYLGSQKNLHTGELYELTEDYLRAWQEVQPLYSNLKQLTDSFEKHWYGLIPASETDWQIFRSGYTQALSR